MTDSPLTADTRLRDAIAATVKDIAYDHRNAYVVADALLPLVVAEVRSAAATAVHEAFQYAADELEALGGPDSRLRRGDVLAWMRNPAVAAGKLLDDLMDELDVQRPNPYRVEEAPPAGGGE